MRLDALIIRLQELQQQLLHHAKVMVMNDLLTDSYELDEANLDPVNNCVTITRC